MKKIILLFISCILLCGCSNKITCIYKENYEDVKIKNKIIIDFKKRKYEQIDIMQFKTHKDALNYFKDIEEYKDEYNLVVKNKKIISKIKDNLKLNGSIKEIKELYENYGYKCK